MNKLTTNYMNILGFVGSMSATQALLLILFYFSAIGYIVYLVIKFESGMRMWLWIFAILFFPFLGSVAYFLKHTTSKVQSEK